MSEQPKLEIRAEAEDLKGRYANVVAVTSQERDVVIDFISSVTVNGHSTGSLVSRIFLNHFTADDLIRVLQENKLRWEQMRYGVRPDSSSK